MRQAGLFGLSDQLKRLSDCGDPLETISRVVNFEMFRSTIEKALAYAAAPRVIGRRMTRWRCSRC